MIEWVSQHASAIASVTAALIAAGASILVAVLARRMQRQQTKLQVEIDQRLTALRDSLERERSFAAFSRERISAHLNAVLGDLVELGAIAHLVGKRTWVDEVNHLETERAVYSAIQSLKVNVRVLFALGAVTKSAHDQILGATGPLWWEWGRVMDEVTLVNVEYRRSRPEEREFSSKVFGERWGALNCAVTKLEDAVVQLPAAIVLPK